MLDTIKIVKPWNGKFEITPDELITIQHDSHSYYSVRSYVADLVNEFKATEDEAIEIVNRHFGFNKI